MLKMDNLIGSGGILYRTNTSLAVGKPFYSCVSETLVLPTPLPKIFNITMLRIVFLTYFHSLLCFPGVCSFGYFQSQWGECFMSSGGLGGVAIQSGQTKATVNHA